MRARFARCGVLKKWDDVSFPKALGTVVTERAIDSLLVLLGLALRCCNTDSGDLNFFERKQVRMDSLLCQFTATRVTYVTAICSSSHGTWLSSSTPSDLALYIIR